MRLAWDRHSFSARALALDRASVPARPNNGALPRHGWLWRVGGVQRLRGGSVGVRRDDGAQRRLAREGEVLPGVLDALLLRLSSERL